MLVQTHFPRKLAPQRYDQYLASGWFRGSVMLYKVDLLCIESGIFGVVNIRTSLDKFAFKKSQRKRMSRCDRAFSVSIGSAKPDAEKESLYALHKERFKGFIHPTLNEYLTSGFHQTVFDTREICVYDGDRLVAVSYFDIGERSMASLIGLQHPDYSQYGLGIYTMLKEIEFGRSAGFKWYYPGYVLDLPSDFDYKLSLGDFEYYTPTKRWGSYLRFDPSETTGARVRGAMKSLGEGLVQVGIEFNERYYPYFSLGFMAPWQLEFLTAPHFFELAEVEGRRLIVGYDPVKRDYRLMDVGLTEDFNHLVRMDHSSGLTSDGLHFMDMLQVRRLLYQTEDVQSMVQNLVSRGWSRPEDMA
ncbi:arginyl-tRNA--protein transferase 1 [bacterium]|nr:arginyl-tRNA--protein transferase 1 [bacterium]